MISHFDIKEFDFNQNATIWDVRDAKSYAEGHVLGAQNKPVDGIGEQDVAQLDARQPLYVLCGGGTKAPRAAEKINQINPSINVIVLSGGTRSAKANQLPMVEGVNPR